MDDMAALASVCVSVVDDVLVAMLRPVALAPVVVSVVPTKPGRNLLALGD